MKENLYRVVKQPSGFAVLVLVLIALLLQGHDNLLAQDKLDVLMKYTGSYDNWRRFTDAENSLYHHLTDQAFDLLDERSAEVASLNSLPEWQKKQREIREVLMGIIGPFPEKTPLKPKILKVIDKDGYRIEHVVFESQPGFYVTNMMLIPSGLRKGKKAPAVLFCSGHTDIAFRSTKEHYQPLILNLVKKGFVVLAMDPVGQGERLQYYDPETGESMVGGSTAEHSWSGAQAFISGSSQARYMTWDGIRAVDYLLSRDEVDPERIGITGCSGGGTQTAYIAACDERIKASVPACYITNLTRLLESIGPQDAEQNLYHGISSGTDQPDYLLVRAPRPVMIMSTTEDFFSIQGARETYREVSCIYRAYGAEENIEMAEDYGGHGTTNKNRELMYAFFQKHLDNPGDPDEWDVELLSEEELRITPTGQLSTSLGGETVFSLNREFTEDLIGQLNDSRKNLREHIPGALRSASKLSGYKEPENIKEPVFNGCVQRGDYLIEKYFVKGEGDYVIPYLLAIPDRPNNKALIYLHPSGKSEEAYEGGEIEWFVMNGFTVLAPDLIGVGETGGGDYVSRQSWYASILIGRSITGIRAGDVSRLVRLLEKRAGITEIHALAREQMSPVLLHAAAFNSSINKMILIEPYSSYRSIVMNRFYDADFVNSTVAGALQAYDLPDLAASLAPRELIIIDAKDGTGNLDNMEEITKDISVIEKAYDFRNASDNLSVVYGRSLSEALNAFILP